MKFGTKLKLKKDWRYDSALTFKKGAVFQVALYNHKYGLKLYYPQVGDLLDFIYGWNDREERLNEFFEVLDETKKEKSCDGCKYKPNEGENYPMRCGECRSFYADMFEERK